MTTRETLTAALLQASVAVQVLVCERVQTVGEDSLPVLTEGVMLLQASVTVAVPNAASMSAAVGLQPKANVEPVALIIGRVISSVQITVLVTSIAALPQASETFHLLVCEREQPLLTTASVVGVGEPVPQSSVAEASPKAASMFSAVGLQTEGRGVAAVSVMTGGVLSITVISCVQDNGGALPIVSV